MPNWSVELTGPAQLPTSTESKSLYPLNRRPPYPGSQSLRVVKRYLTFWSSVRPLPP